MHVGPAPYISAGERALLSSLSSEPEFSGAQIERLSSAQIDARVAAHRVAARLREARDRAREGWLLLGHLRLEQAESALRRALDAFAGAQEQQEACREAAQPLRDLAFLRWQGGKLEEAHRLLAGASRLEAAPPDPRRYPPPFIQFARGEASVDPARLAIVSQPAGARVRVNCRTIGTTPTEVVVRGSILIATDLAQHSLWHSWLPAHEARLVQAKLSARAPLTQVSRHELAELKRVLDAQTILLWRKGPLGLERALLEANAPLLWRPWPTPRRPSRSEPIEVNAHRKTRSLGPWLLAGGAAAIGAAAIGFTVAAAAERDAIEDAAARGDLFDDQLEAADQRRRAFGVTSYALWATAGVALAGALTWWLVAQR